MWEGFDPIACFKDGRNRPWTKKGKQPLEAGQSKEIDSLLEPTENFYFNLARPSLNFQPRKM